MLTIPGHTADCCARASRPNQPTTTNPSAIMAQTVVSIDEIYEKVALLSARLKVESEGLTSRAKKRIFQKIGKYKSDISKLGAAYDVSRVESETAKVIESGLQLDDNVDEVDAGVDEPESKKQKYLQRSVSYRDNENDELEDNEDKEGKENATGRMTKKESKAMIHFIVQQLSEFAVKKQLVKAKKLVKQSKKKGLLFDVHCYTNLINVYVRCNDTEGASKVMKEMEEAKIRPNIVTYTTFLKGLCEVGLISQATELYEKQMIPTYQHNIRSFSTFLRGCLRTGSAENAMKIYRQCFRKYYASDIQTVEHQDTSIIEALVSVLWRSGQFQQASEVVVSYLQSADVGQVSVLESAALYVMLSRCCGVFGMLSEATKYLSLAQTALQQTSQSKLKLKMKRKLLEGEEGGKEAKESSSSELFQTHKHAELTQAVEDIEDYISVIHTIYEEKAELFLKLLSAMCYSSMLSKLMCFGYNGLGDIVQNTTGQNASNIAEKMLLACKEKLGLGNLLSHVYGQELSTNNEHDADTFALVQAHTEGDIENSFDTHGRLSFSNIFPTLQLQNKANLAAQAADGDEKTIVKRVPVYLEIGAGHGDWVVSHAAYHRDSLATKSAFPEAYWLALELRFDRSHEILSKQFFSLRPVLHALLDRRDCKNKGMEQDVIKDLQRIFDTNNLCILSGDATKIVSRHIPHRSVDGIFVNYPQPPERSSGGGTQGQHLLTKEFFYQLYHILAEQGRITILTDNLPYALMLGEIIASTNKFLNIAYADTESMFKQQEFKLEEQKGKVTVYRGQPPSETGHVETISSQSYFDKLWQHGNKKRRWFISVNKM
ncbi:hypothetical protein EON65_07350 [archaeon]|nr:MAG: hypothetical protein EON65_07350 [archaeon]